MKNRIQSYAVLLAAACLFSMCSKDSDNDGYYSGLSPEGGYEQWSEKYTDYGENKFIAVADEPLSTFSVDTDGGSYSNMRRYVNLGQLPPRASVRVEEFLNYFRFDYPEPVGGHAVSVDTEVAVCPWNTGHLLLRVGLQGKSVPESELLPSNYVFLIDVSGSMSSPDKLELLKTGFITLVNQLSARDRVAIVVYAGQAGVVLPSTSCDQKDKIRSAIKKLGSGGSTAGAQGLITAYEIAVANYIPDGNNRIIIGSDGDFNVGPSSNEELVELIESKRDQGIYLTVIGVGSGNLNDSMMEQIANKGNGTYEYIDNVEQLEKVFIHERLKFYTAAKDCKIQVSFNPEQIDRYRLIGYENRVMDNEDFENDAKDAGEIGLGQSVTALYELIPAAANPAGEWAGIDIRYKKPGSEASLSVSSVTGSEVKTIADASEHTRFAASVAAFGMLIRESEFAGDANKELVLSLGRGATGYDPNGYRQQYLKLVEKAKLK